MTLKDLRKKLEKGRRESFLSSKYLFRYISIPFSYVFIKIGLSANQITLISLVFAILGALLQYTDNTNILIISIFLMNLYTVLDHCDGEVARYENWIGRKKGMEGPYLDAIVHYLFTPIFYVSIGMAKAELMQNNIYLFQGVVVAIWLSSFAQSAAYRVIFDGLLEKKITLNDVNKIWSHDKVFDRTNFTIKQLLRSFIREATSTQGQILLISVLVLIDTFLNMGLVSFRIYFLDLMTIIACIGIIKSIYTFYRYLTNINR